MLIDDHIADAERTTEALKKLKQRWPDAQLRYYEDDSKNAIGVWIVDMRPELCDSLCLVEGGHVLLLRTVAPEVNLAPHSGHLLSFTLLVDKLRQSKKLWPLLVKTFKTKGD